MKKLCCSAFIAFFISGFFGTVHSAEMKKEDSFFKSSLHHTTRGMAYWYDKKNNGLETLTGIPYDSDELDCLSCHIASCDRCHMVKAEDRFSYSSKAAKNQDTCLACHKRAKAIGVSTQQRTSRMSMLPKRCSVWTVIRQEMFTVTGKSMLP